MHLFDQGWNKLREQIFANQKKLGVIPQDAKLTPWPKDLLKEWDELTPDEKKLFIRQVDVFAAYRRLYRQRNRPRDPGSRGHGQARQHADHLHQRRQRHQRRRHAASARRTKSRCSTRLKCRSRTSSSISTTSGAPTRPTAHGGAVGLGVRHAVLLDQADRRRISAACGRAWPSHGRG